MQVEHGLAAVRDFGLPTQRIEKATKAERLAWARGAGLARGAVEHGDRGELARDRRRPAAAASQIRDVG